MRSVLLLLVVACTGCSMILPDVSHQPVIHNPFPQLSRVAVAPFFNLSDEKTVDGRKFALAYYAELQAVPGFEVVPLGIVEEAIVANRINLADAGAARRLAQVLNVDAVVVGAVTDYQPYYPPRCGLRVEWYAANPGFHEIPPGYGLPWGTPQEEFIPAPLVFEAEMALAKAQLATQTPACTPAQAGLRLKCDRKTHQPTPRRRQRSQTTRRQPPATKHRALPSFKRAQRSHCRRAIAARKAWRRRCNRCQPTSQLRPARPLFTADCRPNGRTNAASFRRRQAPRGRRASSIVVRL